MTFAFAAAGTGGHVYPALAVADALVEGGIDRSRIVFFGGDRMEAQTVPAAGYRFVQVPLRGLKRSLTASNLTIPAVVRRATALIAESLGDGPSVMAVFGGYVSVPAALAARRRKVPVVIHEQNAVPGIANRFVAGRLGNRRTDILVAFPAALGKLRGGRVIGNPLRRELAAFDRQALAAAARRRYDLPPDVTVLGVVGGSLGARALNEVTGRIADGVDPESVAIVHLAGADHAEALAEQAGRSAARWRVLAFEDDMPSFYAACDLVLSRAGALTVSELAVTGTPAVMVPLVEHQAANAAHLAAAGGAIVIPQEQIDRVPFEIEQLLVDADRRRKMGAANLGAATPDAAELMADVLRKAVND